jgi:hypothetical protein
MSVNPDIETDAPSLRLSAFRGTTQIETMDEMIATSTA